VTTVTGIGMEGFNQGNIKLYQRIVLGECRDVPWHVWDQGKMNDP